MQKQQYDEPNNVPVGEVMMDEEININNDVIINDGDGDVNNIFPIVEEEEAEEYVEAFRRRQRQQQREQQQQQQVINVPVVDNEPVVVPAEEELPEEGEKLANEVEYLNREEQQEQCIVDTLALPVQATGLQGRRPVRNGGEGLVSLHEKKQFAKEARYLAMLYATHMMGWRRDLFKREKEQIALAACTVVSYDLGYKRVTGKYLLDNWLNRVEDSVRYSSSKTVVDNRHKGKTSYMDRLTSNYPQYLHQLW
jgi:hypothetical protein